MFAHTYKKAGTMKQSTASPAPDPPMIIRHQRITIIHQRRPVRQSLNEQLQWLGGSLGLFSLRDKDKSCFRVFIELLKAAKLNQALSSDELAEHLGLSRGTVVHHLNKLMEAGIIVVQGNRYILRVDSLEALIEDLSQDFDRASRDLKAVARDIDEYLGL